MKHLLEDYSNNQILGKNPSVCTYIHFQKQSRIAPALNVRENLINVIWKVAPCLSIGSIIREDAYSRTWDIFIRHISLWLNEASSLLISLLLTMPMNIISSSRSRLTLCLTANPFHCCNVMQEQRNKINHNYLPLTKQNHVRLTLHLYKRQRNSIYRKHVVYTIDHSHNWCIHSEECINITIPLHWPPCEWTLTLPYFLRLCWFSAIILFQSCGNK